MVLWQLQHKTSDLERSRFMSCKNVLWRKQQRFLGLQSQR